MTTEEKAKAYDEAMERAQKVTRAGSDVAMDIVQYIFSELCENEDERIRMEIIEFIEWAESCGSVRNDWHQKKRPAEWIAYLERQKEEEGYEAIPVESTLEYKLGFKAGKESEKQEEQKHILKFKVGDKVHWKGDDANILTITGIEKDRYLTDNSYGPILFGAEDIWERIEQKHYWKPTETDVALFNKAVTTNNTLTPAERAQLDIIRSKFGCCRAVNCSGIVQEEQKDFNKLYEDIAKSEWFQKSYNGKSLGCDDVQEPVTEVFGFKVGDKVRLKDGDGRTHIIKKFEKIEGLHGPDFYHVEFEDNSARDGIYPGEEYPNGYYTQMEKLEKEQKSEQYSPLCNTIKDKIREYVVNHFVTDTVVKTDVKSIVKAMEEGIRLGKEKQKPWVWSEEDEKELDCIINILDRLGYEEFCKSSRDQDIEEERFYYKEIQFLKRLKSLRPQKKLI